MRRFAPLMMVGLALFLVVGCHSSSPTVDPAKDLGSAPSGNDASGTTLPGGGKAGAHSLPKPPNAGAADETFVKPGTQ